MGCGCHEKLPLDGPTPCGWRGCQFEDLSERVFIAKLRHLTHLQYACDLGMS